MECLYTYIERGQGVEPYNNFTTVQGEYSVYRVEIRATIIFFFWWKGNYNLGLSSLTYYIVTFFIRIDFFFFFGCWNVAIDYMIVFGNGKYNLVLILAKDLNVLQSNN